MDSTLTSALNSLTPLAAGRIQPQGWLRAQLQLQADGLTGHLEEIWPDVGSSSAWLGGDGEAWERGPYYLDGLLALALVLADPPLRRRAERWLDAVFHSQQESGMFGPATNSDWWPRMIVAKTLTEYYDATADLRVIPFLRRYFQHQWQELPGRPLSDWGRARGADNAMSVLWLYRQLQEPWLLDLARLVLQQSQDWRAALTHDLIPEAAQQFDHRWHVVNVAMGLKWFAAHALLEDEPAWQDSLLSALGHLDEQHGLVHGMFSGDEWLAGQAPHHGVETCAVVEAMYSLEQLIRVFGVDQLADRLERLAFNLLPASCGPDMRTHQYHQQANQVSATVDRRDWTFSGDDANIFGLEPHFGCCTANVHQGWPKFTSHLWMQTATGGLAAVAYAPCTVSASLPTGDIELRVATSYPFEDEVQIEVRARTPLTFPLTLRVPHWCSAPRLTVNGEAQPIQVDARGCFQVRRLWHHGDEVSLSLPGSLLVHPRPHGAVGLTWGALTLALSPGEAWTRLPDTPGFGDWEVRPRTSWNFALALSADSPASAIQVERTSVGKLPFALENAPLKIQTFGARVKGWKVAEGSAGPPPQSPLWTGQPIEVLKLVPYGCARLRITEFPTLMPLPDATD
ncbi:hypothetical protein E7T06_20545 [Deinococcus sp. Arct2-2]|uniref:beta-L-arabinofuranosidase domain-containing protein n=1 Tax=Deinococcus sp. Arct2-2 TaxID=2568653 RepID=UPI0010A53A17|nr:beta-L-arabinofuranosidase domain-containing protein [Deinococcus sp. Arct2-2]THF66744.1 hypothetical protein E7T06_20545 [Deinococcus sp. Arct2-2]